MKSDQKWLRTIGDILVSILLTVLALIPTWLFLFVKYLLGPEGFWQKLVLFGLGLWFLGFFQFIFLIVLGAVLLSFWSRSGR